MPKILGQEFEQGQHICALYDTPEEQLSCAVAFVAEGLEKRERCLYVADSPAALDRFRSRLGEMGVDAAQAEASGALVLLTSDCAHLMDGRFDTERMLRMLNDAVEEALNDGFTGLRTCGDMSWLLQEAPGTFQIVEYEAILNQFFRNVRGLGMCQYDRSRLPATLLNRAGLAAHSTVVIGQEHKPNPQFVNAP